MPEKQQDDVQIMLEPDEESLKQIEEEEPETTEQSTGNNDNALDDSIKLYLKEIGSIPLISQEEEQKLAILIEKGKAAEAELDKKQWSIGSLPGMIKDLEKQRKKTTGSKKSALTRKINIIKQIKQDIEAGEAARDRMMESNLRLVVSIAKRHIGRGMGLLDMIQEGNLGLMKAVDKFNYHLGYKFSTYATWWIKQGILRALADQGRTIRVPVHMVEKINKYTKVAKEFLQENGRTITEAEAAAILKTTEEAISEIVRIAQDPISLDIPVGDDHDSMLYDFISDNNASATKEGNRIMLNREIEKIMSDVLDKREQHVIRMRFGLEDGMIHTLEEIGNEYHLTRERIRQVEQKAMRKLKIAAKRRHMRDFLFT